MPKGDLNESEHKAQIDKLLSRAQHHRGIMSDEKLTVEHLVLALAENQRFTEILQCAEVGITHVPISVHLLIYLTTGSG